MQGPKAARAEAGRASQPRGHRKAPKQDSACSAPGGPVPTNHVVGKTCRPMALAKLCSVLGRVHDSQGSPFVCSLATVTSHGPQPASRVRPRRTQMHRHVRILSAQPWFCSDCFRLNFRNLKPESRLT